MLPFYESLCIATTNISPVVFCYMLISASVGDMFVMAGAPWCLSASRHFTLLPTMDPTCWPCWVLVCCRPAPRIMGTWWPAGVVSCVSSFLLQKMQQDTQKYVCLDIARLFGKNKKYKKYGGSPPDVNIDQNNSTLTRGKHLLQSIASIDFYSMQ